MIAGGFNGAFWWYGPLSEDQEFLTNLPKLSCGFNGSPTHLQALPYLHEICSVCGFWQLMNTLKVLELKTF